jgi:hypothetical protein
VGLDAAVVHQVADLDLAGDGDGSAVAGLIAGCLAYIATDGTAKKKLAAGVLTGFVVFAGASVGVIST